MIENNETEFKREFTDKIARTIVAFANTSGGSLYIGVDDDGTVVGIDDIDKVQLNVKNVLRDAIRPDVSLYTAMNTEQRDGKWILRLDVGRGTSKPYYLTSHGLRSEGVYVRRGSSNEQASEQNIREMILSSMRLSYEREPSIIPNLTFDYARDYFSRKSLEFGQSHFSQLGFTDEQGRFTNLALLFSDQNPHVLKIAEFGSKDNLSFMDRKEISGSVLKQLEMAYDTLLLYNRLMSKFNGLERVDHLLYSTDSIREALVNSLIHCDYSQSAPSRIEVYDKSMEFINLGGLVDGLSISDLELGASKCRNERLAFIFFRLKLVESYGTGLRRILSHYPGTTVTDIVTVSDHAFRLRLPAEGSIGSNAVNTGREVSAREQRHLHILKIASQNGRITRKVIQQETGCSLGTAIRDLEDLQKQGKLRREGQGKNTEYFPV